MAVCKGRMGWLLGEPFGWRMRQEDAYLVNNSLPALVICKR